MDRLPMRRPIVTMAALAMAMLVVFWARDDGLAFGDGCRESGENSYVHHAPLSSGFAPEHGERWHLLTEADQLVEVSAVAPDASQEIGGSLVSDGRIPALHIEGRFVYLEHRIQQNDFAIVRPRFDSHRGRLWISVSPDGTVGPAIWIEGDDLQYLGCSSSFQTNRFEDYANEAEPGFTPVELFEELMRQPEGPAATRLQNSER